MAALRFCFALLALPPLFAVPVDYELDAPLDLKQHWRFARAERIYLQHQCKSARAAKWLERGTQWLTKPPAAEDETPVSVLQVRLWSDHASYRRAFRFSKDRFGHFNPRLGIVTGYCAMPAERFHELLVLYLLNGRPLRPWQKTFLAGIFAMAESRSGGGLFPALAGVKPVPLQYLVMSNHRPDKAELAAMRQLYALLVKHDRMADFTAFLLREKDVAQEDDTGLDLLESFFPEGLSNNTLPGRR